MPNWSPKLTIEPWLRGERPVDNNYTENGMGLPLDEEIAASVKAIFSGDGGVNEIGCGRNSLLLQELHKAGHATFGFDLDPADRFAEVYKLDLRNPWPINSQQY